VTVRIKAQGSCLEPSLYTDRNPFTWSWPKNKTVTVKADDKWNESEQQEIGTGAEKWNSSAVINCSGVTFNFAGAVHYADDDAYLQDPPDDTVHYQRKRFNGSEGVLANFGGRSSSDYQCRRCNRAWPHQQR
jgi:hypothetical protein